LILFLAGILGLVALGFGDWNKSQKDQAAKIEREGLYTQITNLTSKVSEREFSPKFRTCLDRVRCVELSFNRSAIGAASL
jgi:hypothetical protein